MTPTLHNASKVLMGSHGSSDLDASCEPSDPASFPAGRAVRRASTGALSLSSGDGQLVGVSLGKSLSDTKKTSVARTGNLVPIELAGFAFLVKADLTFFTKRNVAVAIEFLDTGVAGSEVSSVTGDDDAGYVISLSMEDGVSTATQCKAALDADGDTAALIDTLISGTAGTAQADFAEDDIDGAIPALGVAVRVSNSTGKAVNTSGTLTGASYASGVSTGVSEEGASDVPAAYIDMGGGL